MGSGGPRGLQILQPGAKTIRGGFDSHTFPPFPSARRLTGVLLVIVFIAGAWPAGAGEPPQRGAEASPFWASVRSAAFPAWGQLHNGSEKKAVVLFSLETYLLGRVLVTERRARFYDDRLNDENAAWDRADLERRRDDLRDTRSDLVWWSSLLVLYAVIDAYVDAHMVGFDDEVERVERVTASLAPREGGVELAIGVRY